MAGFQGEEPLPVFEIRDEFGPDTDMLIRTRAQGESLARSLGNRAIVLMRGHGATIAAASVRQAVYFAVYAVINARILTQTLLLGGQPTFLNASEGKNVAKVMGEASRTWDYLAGLVTP
jgi:ribulose-5-phosphate 4-epimerase/fuculose-1-phosphate aldolase